MSSTHKTDNYELNQWMLSDKPTMHDYNRDNEIIDAALAAKADQSELEARLAELEAALAGKLDNTDLICPERQTLELENATGTCTYYKVGSLVTVELDFIRSNTGAAAFCQLPPGYRPGKTKTARFTATNDAVTPFSIGISIDLNGMVRAFYADNRVSTAFNGYLLYHAER